MNNPIQTQAQAYLVAIINSSDDALELYKTFRDKEDGCIKVVLTP